MIITQDTTILNKEEPFEVRTYIEQHSSKKPDVYHWHNFFEITYILDGHARYFVNGKQYDVEKGEIILFNHIEAHGWEVLSDEMTLLVLIFGSDFIADRTSIFDYDYLLPFVERGSNFQNKIPGTLSYAREIIHIMNEINREYTQREVGYALMIKSDILKILTILYRNCERTYTSGELLGGKKEAMKRLENSFQYIKRHYCEKIKLEDVARISCMSPNYFSSYFRKVTNMQFQEFLIEMRIQKAREMLRTTDEGILDIAEDCGFSNMSNFYRLFRKYTGYSPGDERKLSQDKRSLEQIKSPV